MILIKAKLFSKDKKLLSDLKTITMNLLLIIQAQNHE